MTGRDTRWRITGAVLGVGACTAAAWDTDGSPLTLLHFLLAILGIVLIVNGKRVAIILQAQRRGHGQTAAAIHAQRIRRRRSERTEGGPSSS